MSPAASDWRGWDGWLFATGSMANHVTAAVLQAQIGRRMNAKDLANIEAGMRFLQQAIEDLEMPPFRLNRSHQQLSALQLAEVLPTDAVAGRSYRHAVLRTLREMLSDLGCIRVGQATPEISLRAQRRFEALDGNTLGIANSLRRQL